MARKHLLSCAPSLLPCDVAENTRCCKHCCAHSPDVVCARLDSRYSHAKLRLKSSQHKFDLADRNCLVGCSSQCTSMLVQLSTSMLLSWLICQICALQLLSIEPLQVQMAARTLGTSRMRWRQHRPMMNWPSSSSQRTIPSSTSTAAPTR